MLKTTLVHKSNYRDFIRTKLLLSTVDHRKLGIKHNSLTSKLDEILEIIDEGECYKITVDLWQPN